MHLLEFTMQLSEFQRRFKSLMLDHPDALQNPPADLAGQFEAGDIPLPERLKVYRNNIVGSITDMMVATFPLIKTLVGEKFLEGMARSFILENPPESGYLNCYGRGFAEFIEAFEPAKGLPYLPDVARLELAANDAYYAKDDKPLSADDLSVIPADQLGDLQLSLRCSATLLSSRYPLMAIRDFCLNEQGEDAQLDLDQGGEALLVMRPALDVQYVSLDNAAFHLLSQLHSGAALGPAVEKTLEQHANFDFQSFLTRHMGLETFCASGANASLSHSSL